MPLEEGLYALSVAGEAAWAGNVPGLALPAIHVSAAPGQLGALEITDTFGRPAAWLGASHSTLLVKSPAGGGLALVTAYPARDPQRPPLQLDIRRLDAAGFARDAAEPAQSTGEGASGIRQPPFATVFLADPITGPAAPGAVSTEIILDVRRRGTLESYF